MKENDLNFKSETAKEKFRLEEKKQSDDMNFKMEKLKLEAKKLEERIKDRQSKEYIAEINKN